MTGSSTVCAVLCLAMGVMVTTAHPTFYPRDALNPVCASNPPPQIYSFHIHCLFWQGNNDSVTAAFALRTQFMAAFNLLDNQPCDDSNTTHPPTNLCMFEPDFPTPAPPFLTSEWAVFVPPQYYQETVLWMTQRRGGLDIFVHPNSGCEIEDHTLWPLWGGKPWELDVSAFHYDCPGCSSSSCRALGEKVMFGGGANATPATCGLSGGSDGTPFQLSNATAFCQCESWIDSVIQLPVGCPHNCDLFNGAPQRACQSYMASLNDFDTWLSAC